MELQEDCGCGARHEGKMAKHTAIECAQDAADVADMITDDMNLPEWLEAKITLASDASTLAKSVVDVIKALLHNSESLGIKSAA